MGIVIAVALAASAATTTYLGMYMRIHPPETPRQNIFYKCSFIVAGLLMIALVAVQAYRSEVTMRTMPKEVAEYIRNTAPPEGYFGHAQSGRPAPAMGLMGYSDGHLSSMVFDFAHRLNEFLATQGEPPRRKAGESNADFLFRSNAWYANVMSQYNQNFFDQAKTITRMLADNGVADRRLEDLASHPINPLGIRALIGQFEAAATDLKSHGR
jgi:hypothetical protein